MTDDKVAISEKTGLLRTPEQEWLWHQFLLLQEEAQQMGMPLFVQYGLDHRGKLEFVVTVKEGPTNE